MNIFSRTNYKKTHTKTTKEDIFLFVKDETLSPKYTKIFGINYSINVYYMKIKNPELNLNKNTINIHLPMNIRHKNNQDLLTVILDKMYKTIANNEMENIMEKARHTFGFAPEEYEIRKIKNTLAYCDKDTQAIYINPKIIMYSKDIIEYIVFHQFCHLKYKTHSKKFYEMLKKYKPNYEILAKQIGNLKY